MVFSFVDAISPRRLYVVGHGRRLVTFFFFGCRCLGLHHVVVSSSSHRVALVRSNPTFPTRACMRFPSRRREVRGLGRQSRMDRLLASFQACLFRSHRPRFTTRPTGRGVVCTRLCTCNRRRQKHRQDSSVLAKARQKDVLLARGAGTSDSGWCAATRDVALGRAVAGVVARFARRAEAGVFFSSTSPFHRWIGTLARCARRCHRHGHVEESA